MIYAPIIIPTLNRYEHLRRCIDSLRNNEWAKYTVLVISVDYPPSDRYWEGYEKLCTYLQSGIAGFLHVVVFYQKENIGAHNNYIFLRNYVEIENDRYIYTEDDNEFSPNFIEYIDKGLELFEENDDILAICASGVINEKENATENIIKTHNYSAHGYGTWIQKEDNYYSKINRKYVEQACRSLYKLLKLYQFTPELVFACQSAILRKEKLYRLPNGEIPIIDMTIKMYAVLEDKYVICPCLQKSRNWGYDGSGANCEADGTEASDMEIDMERSFDYRYPEIIRESRLHEKPSFEIKIRVFAAFIRLFIWRLFHARHA